MTNEEFDWGWAVGLFEGEGSLWPQTTGFGICCAIVSTDRDVVERFLEIVQTGRIGGPYQPPTEHHKQHWRWEVSGKRAVALVERLLPHLGDQRRLLAAKALGRYYAALAAKTAPRPCVYCGKRFAPKYTFGKVPVYCSRRCIATNQSRRAQRMRAEGRWKR